MFAPEIHLFTIDTRRVRRRMLLWWFLTYMIDRLDFSFVSKFLSLPKLQSNATDSDKKAWITSIRKRHVD